MPPPARAAPVPPAEALLSVRAFVFRFLWVFALLEALVVLVLWEARWFGPYAAWNATLTAACLGPFVEGVQSNGQILASPGFSIDIRPGCDAYQAIAVLLAGILSFPAPSSRRWLGGILGSLVLLGLNLARLGVLLWTGIHHPASFDLMHLEVLPALYVGASLALLFGWSLWART